MDQSEMMNKLEALKHSRNLNNTEFSSINAADAIPNPVREAIPNPVREASSNPVREASSKRRGLVEKYVMLDSKVNSKGTMSVLYKKFSEPIVNPKSIQLVSGKIPYEYYSWDSELVVEVDYKNGKVRRLVLGKNSVSNWNDLKALFAKELDLKLEVLDTGVVVFSNTRIFKIKIDKTTEELGFFEPFESTKFSKKTEGQIPSVWPPDNYVELTVNYNIKDGPGTNKNCIAQIFYPSQDSMMHIAPPCEFSEDVALNDIQINFVRHSGDSPKYSGTRYHSILTFLVLY